MGSDFLEIQTNIFLVNCNSSSVILIVLTVLTVLTVLIVLIIVRNHERHDLY